MMIKTGELGSVWMWL